MKLKSEETRRLWLSTSKTNKPIVATLTRDALAIDNEVVLLPVSQKPLRVQVSVSDERLRRLIRGALDAAGSTKPVSYLPRLLITDSLQLLPSDDRTWLLRFESGEEGETFVGPFVIDRSHPLTEGLQLTGVIWSAITSDVPPGRPIISAGNVPLVTVRKQASGCRDIFVRFNPQLSTLQQSPNFPVLMWNILRWRMEHRPGVETPNARLGTALHVGVDRRIKKIKITDPAGEVFELPTPDARATWPGSRVGLWEVQTVSEVSQEGPFPVESVTYQIAVHALSQDESDLTQRSSGRFGTWINEESIEKEYRSIAWVLLLGTLGMMLAHAYLVARAGGPR